MKWTTLLVTALFLMTAACGDDAGGSPIVGEDGGPGDGPSLDGPEVDVDAGGPPADARPRPDAGPDDPTWVPAPCATGDADHWTPDRGFNGGIHGDGVCGSRTGSCPTTYVDGNVGDPCASAADCSGLDPVCLTGSKYVGGSCSSRGCELGSNLGCPAGDTCIDGGDDTYCLEGCGIAAEGCFIGCPRDGYACFSTESKSMGYCLAAAGAAECDPTAATTCASSSFPGDGLCDQSSWDDPTVGNCLEMCDPLAQDCTNPAEGCYVVRDVAEWICYQNWGFAEGASCKRVTECGEGLTCQCDFDDRSLCPNNENMHCRRYCGASLPCPAGHRCRVIEGGVGACIPS